MCFTVLPERTGLHSRHALEGTDGRVECGAEHGRLMPAVATQGGADLLGG